MTEYDLSKRQLIDTLSAALRASIQEDWSAASRFSGDIALLAKHLLTLQTHEAPSACSARLHHGA